MGLAWHRFETPAKNTIIWHNGTSWFDWNTIDYRQVPVTLTPARHVATEDGSVTFSAAVTGAPAGATFRWDFEGATDPESGDLLVKETIDTPIPTLNYRLERAKMGVVGGVPFAKMTVRVLDAKGRPVGRDEAFVKMVGDQVAWRLESISSIEKTGADADFDAVLANPSEWVVFVFLNPVPAIAATFPTPGVYLQRRPGHADVPIAFAPTGATTIPLAHRVINPGVRVTGTHTWTGDVTSGQVEGNGTPLNQTCTQFLGSITATKAGEVLSGEIGRHITRLAACDGGLLDILNRATFTARRLPPAG
ncbi:MAG: hypothetical protein AB7L66_06845 [Gemmatimonadales bacterium]